MSSGDELINPLLSNFAGGGYRGLGDYGDLCDRHPEIVKRIHSFNREGSEVGSYVTSFILKNFLWVKGSEQTDVCRNGII